jgi:OOP family OmpA-OmpF porin
LRNEPGIQVTSSEKHSGIYRLYGLRDPSAADPVALLKKEKLEPKRFDFHFEPYTSNHPQVILKRIAHTLEPPPTVKFEMKDDGLTVSGSAPHAWILRMREGLRSVPGVSRYQDSDLADVEAVEFDVLKKKIEDRYFLFEFRSEEFLPGQEAELRVLVEDMKNFLRAARELERSVHVEILGHADSLGTEQGNLLVSQARAQRVLSLLIREGLEAKYFTAAGLGSHEPFREEKTSQDRKLNRRVIIRVSVDMERGGDG